MYLPTHFEETRPDVLHQLVRSHPLGLLVTHRPDGLQADAVPFLIDPARGPHGTLRAHVARSNPVWREARTNVEPMVVFQGPQAYISPGWYPSKADSGKVVPTWNYVMVQAHGTLKAIDDAGWVRGLVSELTGVHESTQAAPWSIDDAPPDYVDAMLRHIVGIEIELSALRGKWKVSQNRSAADRAGVVRGLGEQGGEEAARMAALVGRSETG